MPRTITAKTIAWVTVPCRLAEVSNPDANPLGLVDSMAFFSNEDIGKGSNPWFRVGTATITVELADEERLAVDAVAALRSEQQTVRAEAERRANDIERQIQTLLAISCDKAVAA